MYAAVLHEKGLIRYEEIEKPRPQADEVLVRVSYSGICGSDVPRFLEGKVQAFPLVLGHEFSGVITDAGSEANSDLIGKHVAGIPLVPCHSCDQCQEGHYSLCPSYGFIGSRRQGSFAEYVAVPQGNVFVFDEAISDIQAAFFEPATVALHAIALLEVPPGACIAVLGMGTIGILLAQALRAYDPAVVVHFNRSSDRMKAAADCGLDKLVDTSEKDWLSMALGFSSGRRFTHVFDTAGAASTIAQAFELAAPCAKICLVGTPKADIGFSVSQWENINRKELTLKGSWMSYSKNWPGQEWETVRKLFHEGILSVREPMIEAIYPLSDIDEAFGLFAIPNRVRGKILVNCARISGSV
jgi:L-iditol 2-dehydrogenase